MHKALVQEVKTHPLVVKQLPTPQATAGSAVIKIISVPIVSYARDVYDGTRKIYAYPTPIVPGASAIGRVSGVGPDATKLKEGDLVLVDCYIHGRDDNDAMFLFGTSETGSEGSRILMHGEWRNATFAEYCKAPLENCFALDESRLCRGLGYEIDQLGWILQGLVPYGGLKSIGLQPGETIVIAPATGGFGSAAVVVALSMGARVIAMARNATELEKIKSLNRSRIDTVAITGNQEQEIAALKKFGRINAFLDISPPMAQNSTHFKSAISSLSRGGRVSLMGGFIEDVAVPHRFIMRNDIALKGKFMYDREDILSFLQLLESGVLDFKDIVKVTGKYGLQDWKEALDTAFEQGGRLGHLVVFNP
jgi:D-arabinose 1-dehydrogenase-like Zn-dependent alcohol dehydrogenase